jgi:hypothetical protein
MVACKREIRIHLNTLNDEMVPGTITSVELEDSDAPLRAGAQQRLGLVIDMGNHTIYSHKLDKELELIMHNGLPSMALHPGEPGLSNIVLNAIDEQHDIQDNVHDDDGIIKYVDTLSEDEISEINKGGSGYMPITEGKVKILTRKQRTHLQESLDEVEKEDCAMWSTLSPDYKRPRRMLPRGCKSFLMEIFVGAATLSCIAVNIKKQRMVHDEVEERS